MQQFIRAGGKFRWIITRAAIRHSCASGVRGNRSIIWKCNKLFIFMNDWVGCRSNRFEVKIFHSFDCCPTARPRFAWTLLAVARSLYPTSTDKFGIDASMINLCIEISPIKYSAEWNFVCTIQCSLEIQIINILNAQTLCEASETSKAAMHRQRPTKPWTVNHIYLSRPSHPGPTSPISTLSIGARLLRTQRLPTGNCR